jgi:Carboxypeptidase regulatory-like domain
MHSAANTQVLRFGQRDHPNSLPSAAMTRSLVFAFLLVGAGLFASAQQSASRPNASSISGTVVQEPGSQPLKKVLVQVVPEDQSQGGNYTDSTDSDGHFHIENVAPGRYRIYLERTGFTGVNERGRRSDTNIFTVQAGQSLEELVFRMLPTAVIVGRITDEDGDPMSGVNVIAEKKQPGKARRESVASGTTNDMGEYRLFDLFPGQYWVVAIPPPDFRDYESTPQKSASGHDDNSTSAAKPETRYLTTYYPGVSDAMQASALTLKAGDEMPANFTLVPTRTYRVRGTIAGIAPGQKASVEMFSKAGDSYRANSTEIGPDGQFEVRGVGPGSYVIRASLGADSQPLTARQDISVVAGDVAGVKLVPHPVFTISGNLHVQNNAAADLTQYVVNLRASEVPDDAPVFLSQESAGEGSPVDRFGHFESKNVSPGNYIVQVFGGGSGGDGAGGNGQSSYLKSATLGGQDITTGFTASGPATLELVLSTKGATIEGTVIERQVENEEAADNDQPATNATVVAVPEERYRKIPSRFVAGATDQRGRFVLRGLAPGSYTLYAWQDVEDGLWRDAAFLKSQEANGTSVKVEEGSNQRIELQLTPLGDDWQ